MMNPKESIETIVRKYLMQDDCNYLTVLSDLKKKGYDDETKKKIFERYQELKLNTEDKKTKFLNAKDHEKLNRSKGPSEMNKIIAVFIGLGCAVISMAGFFSLYSIPFLFLGCFSIGNLISKALPIAHGAGFFVFFMLIGFAFEMYMQGRQTILNIELAIPVALASIPAYGIYYLIANLEKRI